MAIVLAIEPDPRQASILRRMVQGEVCAELVLVDSKDAALAALAARVPDLILVTALLPPRDEDALTEHLKTLDFAPHLQTLTIPLLASSLPEAPVRSGVFASFRRRRRNDAISGCDPAVFAQQVQDYLKRAEEVQAENPRFVLTAPSPNDEAPALEADLPLADIETSDPNFTQLELALDVPLALPALPPSAMLVLARAMTSPLSLPSLANALAGPANRRRRWLLPVESDTLAPAFLARVVVPPPLAAAAVVFRLEPNPLTLAGLAEVLRARVPAPEPLPVAASATTPKPTEEQADASDTTADLSPDIDTGLWDRLFGALEERFRETASDKIDLRAPDAVIEAAPAVDVPPSVTEPGKVRRRKRRSRKAAQIPESAATGVDGQLVASALASLRLEIERLRLESQAKHVELAYVDDQGEAEDALPHDEPASPREAAPVAPESVSVQDEWGFYDPNRCGMAALMARLDAEAASRPAGARECGPKVPVDVGPQRLKPLAVWARAVDGDREEHRAAAAEAPADLSSLMAGLRVPDSVAGVRYASGCRIQRVRVKKRPVEPSTDRQVIILSSKALRKLSR